MTTFRLYRTSFHPPFCPVRLHVRPSLCPSLFPFFYPSSIRPFSVLLSILPFVRPSVLLSLYCFSVRPSILPVVLPSIRYFFCLSFSHSVCPSFRPYLRQPVSPSLPLSIYLHCVYKNNRVKNFLFSSIDLAVRANPAISHVIVIVIVRVSACPSR